MRSAGTERNARIKVTGGMLGWADVIFTMEKKHTSRIQEKYKTELQNKRVICLYIPDDYEYMEEQLIEIIKEKVAEHLR
ncbi:MAG: protein tyrosine phosphatase [Oscillospiraceae bacterium]|nr:protein tyrosine phosphatase [Oscillospiraceae bacterium]